MYVISIYWYAVLVIQLSCVKRFFVLHMHAGIKIFCFPEAGLVSVPHAIRSNFPAKICTSLSSWQPISWDDFRQAPHTQALVQAQCVNRGDTFYRAVLARGTGKY